MSGSYSRYPALGLTGLTSDGSALTLTLPIEYGSPASALVAPLKIKAAGSDGASIVLEGTGGIINPSIAFRSVSGTDSCATLTSGSDNDISFANAAGNVHFVLNAGIDATGMGAGAYIKLKSPNGTTFTVTVSNAGVLTVV